MHTEAMRRCGEVLVTPEISISEAMRRLEAAGTGALVVVDADRKLLGLLTDGDFRRAILAGISFDRPCVEIARSEPVVARHDISVAEALRLMDESREYTIHQLPLVNGDRAVVGLLLRGDLSAGEAGTLSAVIMAGGFGTRLMPLTRGTPKPMLPVGDRPILEHTIERLREAGIRNVNVTTHYLAECITDHFGDGSEFGVDLHYVTEDRPLGTAGGLSLLPEIDGPVLVINGDIMTRVDFRSMLAYHREQRAEITVGVRQYDVQVPYGVVECTGPMVSGIREKPVHRFFVNAGIYLLEPSVRPLIPDGQRYDMPDLIQRLLDDERPVASFPIVEYWIDVGRHGDYERAQMDVSNGALAR